MLLADEVAAYHPVLSSNPYQPHMARIVRIYKMVENNHLFTLRFLEDHLAHTFRHQPGQFIMLSVPCAGEIPIKKPPVPAAGSRMVSPSRGFTADTMNFTTARGV